MHKQMVVTDKGQLDVPAIVLDECPGLAVTMSNFGLFEVTHGKSGRKLSAKYERAINAVVSMMQIQVALNEINVSADLDEGEFKEAAKSQSGFQHKELGGMSIIESVRFSTGLGDIASEFPWEGPDDGPYGERDRLEALLNGKTN